MRGGLLKVLLAAACRGEGNESSPPDAGAGGAGQGGALPFNPMDYAVAIKLCANEVSSAGPVLLQGRDVLLSPAAIDFTGEPVDAERGAPCGWLILTPGRIAIATNLPAVPGYQFLGEPGQVDSLTLALASGTVPRRDALRFNELPLKAGARLEVLLADPNEEWVGFLFEDGGFTRDGLNSSHRIIDGAPMSVTSAPRLGTFAWARQMAATPWSDR